MKKKPSAQPSPSVPVAVRPSGDPWTPSPDNPATVPMPWEVIVVKVHGDYTERDRKLYAFLVHAVWDEMETTRIHELSVAEINKVFRELGGDFSPQWIWESATRLNKTQLEWEEVENGECSAQGAASLLSSVRADTKAKESGYLQFEIPAALIPIFKNPDRFARLRIHFMLGLSGKYAVTLYEILESVVNMRNPVLEVDLTTLRKWLKVTDGKLDRYVDFKRRVIEPALRQINDNPEGAGFSVEMQPIKVSRAVDRIRFILTKTAFRTELEGDIKRVKSQQAADSSPALKLRTATYEKAKKAAPSFDIYYLEKEWRDWVGKQETLTTNPDGSFVSFCRNKQKDATK
jgi:hypothetical protein